MPWVRISDDYSEHPKMRDLSASAVAMWLAGVAYANRNLTDGVIPTRVTGGLIVTDGLYEKAAGRYREVTPKSVIRELISHGLWHDSSSTCDSCVVPNSRAEYVVHNYLEYQPSRTKILEEREKTRARVERYRANREPRGTVGNGVTDGRTNGGVTHAPKSQSQERPRHNESSHDSYAAEGATDAMPSSKFLEAFAAQAGITDVPAIVASVYEHTGVRITGDRAIGVARSILDKSPRPIRAAQRYVLSAIAQSPAEIEQALLGGAA